MLYYKDCNIYKNTGVILFNIYWLVDRDSNLFLCNLNFKKTETNKKPSPYKLPLNILDY